MDAPVFLFGIFTLGMLNYNKTWANSRKQSIRESVRRETNQYHHTTPYMAYGGYDHTAVIVKDSVKAKEFLISTFGATDETCLRPTTIPFPGAFLRFVRRI